MFSSKLIPQGSLLDRTIRVYRPLAEAIKIQRPTTEPANKRTLVTTTPASNTTNNTTHDIKIVEVGPRDGLQNESQPVSTNDKVQLIRGLAKAGCSVIEAGAFVSPKWVPQMADSKQVFQILAAMEEENWFDGNDDNENDDNVIVVGTRQAPRQQQHRQQQPPKRRPYFSCLVPNIKGLEQALELRRDNNNDHNNNSIPDEIAIFGAASEAFSQRNIACSIDESIERFRSVVAAAKAHDDLLPVRGYVSTVVGCPYQGEVPPAQVAKVVEQMLELGCYEISLGDTIGVGTPGSVRRMLDEVLTVANPSQLAMHCHDTYGQALANICVGLERGITTIDSSVAGLGGCPYAKGASGNVATEDVVYMLNGMGLSTGINLDALVPVGERICEVIGRPSQSKVALAMMAKEKQAPKTDSM